MKRKTLVAVLVIILSATMAVTVVAPALANRKSSKDSNVVVYGQHGEVTLQLPSGIPTHPTALGIVASDWNRKSEFGACDSLSVALWIPAANSFVPVLQLLDNPNPDYAEFLQKLYNNTPVWNPIMPNIIQVADNELDVWTEGDVIIANLTSAEKVTLPFNLMVGTPIAAWGNLTFELPPMTLTFRPIAHGFSYEETTTILPHPPYSGYTVEVKSWQSPAWVYVEIPLWIHMGRLEATGHICTHLTQTGIPPAT
jgi:hypothetical protein